MDASTREHFDRWAYSEGIDHEEDTIDAMLAEYATDPDYYAREGWWKLYDVVLSFEGTNFYGE